jgi:demethylspheroidene O-methyltransferase
MSPSWRERLRAVGDRWLASPKFQRWAVQFPLTRPIARRRARALFDLCAGFVYSQVLLACVRLRVLEILAESPLDARALADRVALPTESMQRLLDAACSLQLVRRRNDGCYTTGQLGAALLGNAGVAAMVDHHGMLYADLADPVALLREGSDRSTRLARYWAYAATAAPAQLDTQHIADYTRLMSQSQELVADQILSAYSLRRHRCLLDVGGGDGTFLTHAAARHPHLRLMLFDLPAVAQRAQARFTANGLASRAQVLGGDFYRDGLPRGADVVSFVRVLHDHDDEAVAVLLRSARRALPDDGVIVVAEPMAGTRGAETVADAYFGFYLLAMGQGRARTPETLARMLIAAGFAAPRRIPTPMPLQTSLLMARCQPGATSDV